MPTLALRTAESDDLPVVNGMYESVKFKLSTPADLIVLAEIDGVAAGIGRLVTIEAGVLELGGIYVDPSFRGGGVARRVVAWLVERAPRGGALYCLPFRHLTPFYCGFGFAPIDDLARVPEVLRDKLRWCGTSHDEPVDALVMRGMAR